MSISVPNIFKSLTSVLLSKFDDNFSAIVDFINANTNGSSWKNSDKLGNYPASAAPAASSIPVSDANSRLPWGWQPAFRGCVAIVATAGTIPNITDTKVAFASADIIDTDNIHDPASNNSKFYVPSGVSKVRFSANVYLPVLHLLGVTPTQVRVSLLSNGGIIAIGSCWVNDPANDNIGVFVQSSVRNAAAGEYFEVSIYHASGSSEISFTAEATLEILE